LTNYPDVHGQPVPGVGGVKDPTLWRVPGMGGERVPPPGTCPGVHPRADKESRLKWAGEYGSHPGVGCPRPVARARG